MYILIVARDQRKTQSGGGFAKLNLLSSRGSRTCSQSPPTPTVQPISARPNHPGGCSRRRRLAWPGRNWCAAAALSPGPLRSREVNWLGGRAVFWEFEEVYPPLQPLRCLSLASFPF